jgi:hypothetical protein
MSRYLPSLTVDLIDINSLPSGAIFDELKSALQNLKLFYKDLQCSFSYHKDSGHYNLEIVTKDPIKYKIPGLDINICLNNDNLGIDSAFPVTLDYNWPILRFVHGFQKVSQVPSVENCFEILTTVFDLQQEVLMQQVIYSFIDDFSPLSRETQIAEKINTALNSNPVNNSQIIIAPAPSPSISLAQQFCVEISQKYPSKSLLWVVYEAFLLDNTSSENTWKNIETFFRNLYSGKNLLSLFHYEKKADI